MSGYKNNRLYDNERLFPESFFTGFGEQDDCFDNWFEIFRKVVEKLFPNPRALGVLRKNKVLRPTEQ